MNRLLAVTSAAVLLLGCSSNPLALDVVDHITGLDKPWDVTWTPRGEMLFTENNTGDVWVAVGGSATPIHNVSDLDRNGSRRIDLRTGLESY